MYTVTVRDRHGRKIARQIQVDDGSVTVAQVVEEGQQHSRLEWMVSQWHRNFGNRPITDWWTVKNPFAKPEPPPIPEPIGFDVLVNQHSI